MIKRGLLILNVVLLSIAFAGPVLGKSMKRHGKTFRSDRVEITNIESKKLEKDRSGLIYYTIKANVRNRAKRPLVVTLELQALDRSGYEIEDVFFYEKRIGKYDTITFTDRLLMQAQDYEKIWEWKVDRVRIE